MNATVLLIVRIQSLAVGLWTTSAMASADKDVLPLVNAGKPACTLVVVTDSKPDALLKRSAEPIAETIKLWSGVVLPTAALSETNRKLSTDPAIVLVTLDTLKNVAPDLIALHKELAHVDDLDEQGFVCVPLTIKNAKQLLVVSKTPRGLYNGAVYLRDFCIDGDKQNLDVQFQPIVRSPKMGGRSAYTLTIWKQECKYTAADWETEFKSFARDGIDRIYFWASGHFPSKQFPQAYKCKNVFDGKQYDTTEETRIGSVQDLKDIVASAHKLGLKIYLGGGLGGWCGTQFLTNLEPDTLKTGPKEPSLCPSNPKSRKALIDYYQEMFAAIPEADGLFIESADEIGECECPLCSRAIDDLGSRQFGQSQLSLCQEIMTAVWRDNPHARLAYTIGYPEHAKDVAYYNLIQRMSKDPRIEWMEARKSWSFPGPGGDLRPAAFFSNRVMRWKLYCGLSYEEMIADANRVGTDGMFGMGIDFSPGFATGSFYNDIPFPTDILPYSLTGFVFREATWNPALTVEEMHDCTQNRFFGKEAPKYLGDDLWKLREIIRTKKGLEQIRGIEKHINEAHSNASPKTSEGLAMMTRAVNDIRIYLPPKKRK
jgi:hypothetical protein